GSHRYADGLLHDAVDAAGGRLTHLDAMWNYAAGVRHPRPRKPIRDNGGTRGPSRSETPVAQQRCPAGPTHHHVEERRPSLGVPKASFRTRT
ncbi:MAG: hypothetical protein J0L74_04290, partial [Burkholderiales bacterium]|nr:hypothetical protein [Burkholderiales bacterium]